MEQKDLEELSLFLKSELEAIDFLREVNLLLQDYGIKIDASFMDAAGAVMIAEAVNYAAKVFTSGFYSLKVGCIKAALLLGAEGGWDWDEAENMVIYLNAPGVGTASFHVFEDMEEWGIDLPRWEYGWSGIPRQDMAFLIGADQNVRKLFAEATDPEGSLRGIDASVLYKMVEEILSD